MTKKIIHSTFFEWTSERFDDLWNIETELLQEVKNQSYLEMLGVKFKVESEKILQ